MGSNICLIKRALCRPIEQPITSRNEILSAHTGSSFDEARRDPAAVVNEFAAPDELMKRAPAHRGLLGFKARGLNAHGAFKRSPTPRPDLGSRPTPSSCPGVARATALPCSVAYRVPGPLCTAVRSARRRPGEMIRFHPNGCRARN